MNRFKSFYTTVLIFLLIATAIVGWKYISAQQKISDLEKQVIADMQPSSILEQNKHIDPPSGDEADTSNWSVAEDTFGRFTLLYPDNWTTEPSGKYIVIPERFAENDDYLNYDLLPLSLSFSTNTNTNVGIRWREITLANGEQVYYSFEDGFDHYHMVSSDKRLTLSIPSRSYDGLYTDQELKEATQIVNTYRPLL